MSKRRGGDQNAALKAFEDGMAKLLPHIIKFIRSFKVDKMDLRIVMRYHAYFCITLGLTTMLLPHKYLSIEGEGYIHYAHEFIRLYGCLTLAIGWIVWKVSLREVSLNRDQDDMPKCVAFRAIIFLTSLLPSFPPSHSPYMHSRPSQRARALRTAGWPAPLQRPSAFPIPYSPWSCSEHNSPTPVGTLGCTGT